MSRWSIEQQHQRKEEKVEIGDTWSGRRRCDGSCGIFTQPLSFFFPVQHVNPHRVRSQWRGGARVVPGVPVGHTGDDEDAAAAVHTGDGGQSGHEHVGLVKADHAVVAIPESQVRKNRKKWIVKALAGSGVKWLNRLILWDRTIYHVTPTLSNLASQVRSVSWQKTLRVKSLCMGFYLPLFCLLQRSNTAVFFVPLSAMSKWIILDEVCEGCNSLTYPYTQHEQLCTDIDRSKRVFVCRLLFCYRTFQTTA